MGRAGRQGGGGGGRDSLAQPPVDQYRRRIGQETRKEKQLNKEVSREKDHIAYKNCTTI